MSQLSQVTTRLAVMTFSEMPLYAVFVILPEVPESSQSDSRRKIKYGLFLNQVVSTCAGQMSQTGSEMVDRHLEFS